MTTTEEVACPKCGGRTWDNRETKKNPKAPDYKCRDKGCDGAVWPPKGAPAAPARPNAPQAYSVPAHVPAIDGPKPFPEPEYGDERAAREAIATLQTKNLDGLFSLYRTCLTEAISASQKIPNATPDAIVKVAATLFIAAKDRHAA